MSGHLLLLDASGFVHRAYHGTNPRFRSDGLPTWAIEGFLALMWRLLGAAQADQPTHAAACFDAPGQTFRHKLFPAYKTNRPARDEELLVQLPWLRHAARTMGMEPVEREGFEADDVVATLAAHAVKFGYRVSIVSSDKDLLQLVQTGRIEVIDPMTRLRIDEAGVRNGRLGVEPHQVPDYQALAGDSVDNIPGIDGIGSKTAAILIRNFRTVEGVVEAANNRSQILTPAQRLAIRGRLEDLRLYRTLATLRTDAPINVDLTALVLQPVLRDHVDVMLAKLEATSRFETIFAGEPKMQRVVPHIEEVDRFEWWEEEQICSGQPIPETPQCGFYLGRLIRKGPLVPSRIWRSPEVDFMTGAETGSDLLQCEIAGERRDPVREWPYLCKSPIGREEFDFQMSDGAWAKAHSPDEPKANPREPVDLTKAPIPHFKEKDRDRRRKSVRGTRA